MGFQFPYMESIGNGTFLIHAYICFRTYMQKIGSGTASFPDMCPIKSYVIKIMLFPCIMHFCFVVPANGNNRGHNNFSVYSPFRVSNHVRESNMSIHFKLAHVASGHYLDEFLENSWFGVQSTQFWASTMITRQLVHFQIMVEKNWDTLISQKWLKRLKWVVFGHNLKMYQLPLGYNDCITVMS